MVPEKKLEEFVETHARGSRGEPGKRHPVRIGRGGDFHPEFSNLNLFCVLRDSSFAALQALAPVAQWWEGQKQPPPLFMTRRELECSTDIFTIELLDMQRASSGPFRRRCCWQGLQIPLHLHRVQVEYELREKLVLLRQQLLLPPATGGDGGTCWCVPCLPSSRFFAMP